MNTPNDKLDTPGTLKQAAGRALVAVRALVAAFAACTKLFTTLSY